MIREDEPLFSWDTDGIEPDRIERMKINREQIEQLRQAFDDVGIVSQEDRKKFVGKYYLRPVAGLRDLFADEVPRLMKNILDATKIHKPTNGSAWDNRDEDTWIDKL